MGGLQETVVARNLPVQMEGGGGGVQETVAARNLTPSLENSTEKFIFNLVIAEYQFVVLFFYCHNSKSSFILFYNVTRENQFLKIV